MTSPATSRNRNDRFGDVFDLYNELGHWGQVRLAQIGPSTVLQVNIDGDKNGWQEFQQFTVIGDRLHYGIVGRRPPRT